MKTATIEELAYLIKQAKVENLPKPIIFLGAGASKTGGIPLAGEIVDDILKTYNSNPKISSIKNEDKTYPKLMECLIPFERNKLLKEYIDNAKINVTHIYLAQLLNQGYIDYVLTVNFDNLMLRASALFNDFPPTYDMAILKDLTTTSFKEKSVVYLHGQHHGLWLLNTEEEMSKVNNVIPPILNKIANQRPWIFIGYSGEDPIFEHIANLGRFDNGLYWIAYYDKDPNEKVCTDLLEKPNTNASVIKGYDADSFMLKLNNALKLPQPSIIDKPFTSLKISLESIVDIDDKDHFEVVKERLEIVKKEVGTAIAQFEEGNIETKESLKEEVDSNLLNKQIIDKIIKKEFDEKEVELLKEKANNSKNTETNKLLASLYSEWGAGISMLARLKNDEDLYENNNSLLTVMPQYLTRSKAFHTNEPFCVMSDKEQKRGKEILLSKGIDIEESHVTAHARDDEFHNTKKAQWDHRNTEFKSILQALSYLSEKNQRESFIRLHPRIRYNSNGYKIFISIYI